MWDGIKNTANGHDNTSSIWKDLIGSWDLTRRSVNGVVSSWWGGSYIGLPGSTTQELIYADDNLDSSLPATVEIVLSPLKLASAMVLGYFGQSARGFGFFADNTINFNLGTSLSYLTGVTSFGDI